MSTGSGSPAPFRVPLVSRRWVRFLIAGGCGALFLPLSAWASDRFGVRLLLSLDVFFAAYLLQMLRISGLGPDELRAHTAEDDEGGLLISLLGLLAFVVSMGAIVNALARPDAGAAEAVLGLLAVPLGWATVHALAAHHYAHLYYSDDPAPDRDVNGGLVFPGSDRPGAMDFLYFSYCVGMAAQVSDVIVTTRAMRRVVTIHAICSFFANAVILALAVNAAASLRF